MTAEDDRSIYYRSRVQLVSLIAQRDRLLRSLQWKAGGIDGAFLATQDGELLVQIDVLTAEIAAATKLVNLYADRIGSPRVRNKTFALHNSHRRLRSRFAGSDCDG